MTEPAPEKTWDVNAEVDALLAKVVSWYGLDELEEARGIMRRALMYAWYDGNSAGLNQLRQVGPPRQNPWLRSVK